MVISDNRSGRVSLSGPSQAKSKKHEKPDFREQRSSDHDSEENLQSVEQTQRKLPSRRKRSRASSSTQLLSSSSEDAMIDELNEEVDL